MPTAPKQSINDKWQEIADRIRDEASRLPPGKNRDAMLTKAQQLETARQINDWISSLGLQAPVELAGLTK